MDCFQLIDDSLTLRRPRAETMPTSFPPLNTTLIEPKIGLHSSWVHDHHPASTLQSPTTPTTDQLLKGDDNNTIASTFASLGLDEHQPSSSFIKKLPHRTIHTSHSYSSLHTLSENQQENEEEVSLPYLTKGEDLRSSVAQLRLSHHINRPRAMSAIDPQFLKRQQDDSINPHGAANIWHSDMIIHRPFLRSSNSSADLLEMMARQQQRKTSVTNPSNVLNEDSHSVDDATLLSLLQPPTRSLWLGQMYNITHQTSTDLNNLFSQFGVVESIRLLPDRDCAFVNFASVEDAVRAKDIVVNKMACRLFTHPVNVGFGKLSETNSSTTAATTTTTTTAATLHSPIPAHITPHDTTTTTQGPTRALWVGNIPMNTTQTALGAIFASFGMIESVRVLSHKNCGFINFVHQEDAVRAKRTLHNKEIMGPGTGSVKIGFAKVPPSPALHHKSSMSSTNSNQQQQMMVYMMEQLMGNNSNNVITALVTERKLIMQELSEDDSDGPTFDALHLPQNYYHSIPAAPELGQSRKVDISRLRDIRKRLDTGNITIKELEIIAVECLDEIVELCSDYIGNTVIQRLFEKCSDTTKSVMLERVAPYLASIGVHKNGTWAAQKIIETTRLLLLPPQIALLCNHIKPYVPALLLDQFGNYVVQCCLGLGPHRNQFIFDAIVDSCWEIAQGRFGARAVRATLESPHVTKRQQKYVAAALVQHALLLATNANGALLLIWLLDTSGIPGRYRVLAPRLLPHLSKLCTHKLASLTILKLINQRQEPEARTMILDALFFTSTGQDMVPSLIEDVLRDQVHGVNLVQKVLSSSYIDLRERQRIAERVKHYLAKLKLQHVQGYKRLVEEINMVMVDSAPGATLGVSLPTQFSISPGLAAALHAKYAAMHYDPNDNDTNGGLVQTEDPTAMMANFYAAAATAAASLTSNGSLKQEDEDYPHEEKIQ
ncbi:MAG: armadillo-type protein [Benjaminiella poitrasii]|nr:MAG: armadillo-type protein [Benjaminiella poitrasii]